MSEHADGNLANSLRTPGKLVLALLGVIVGLLFLWLALRKVEGRDIATILRTLSVKYLLLAVLVYWIGIVLRIFRWRRMLAPYFPASFLQVSETLIVGFAVNYLLPARLGELFRADYARRRFGIPRFAALGSIAVERLTDGVIVVCLLWLGLVATMKHENVQDIPIVSTIAKGSTAVFLVALVCVFLVIRCPARLRIGPKWLQVRIASFVVGLSTLNVVWTWRMLLLSLAIWGAETLALWLVFQSVSFTLDLGLVLMLTGAATLSTIVPTAPEFIGSYQLVFVIAMKAIGSPPAVGLVAATTIQVAFFGTVTLIGLAIFMSRHLSGAVRSLASTDNDRIT